MKVQDLIQLLENYKDTSPVIVMTPEMGHALTYKITEVKFDSKLEAVIIDVQRSS
jgi:hypothetical protein